MFILFSSCKESIGEPQRRLPRVNMSTEALELQEALVRANLKTKSLIATFPECRTHRQMEELNYKVRSQLERMRQALERLRNLSAGRGSDEVVEGLADQLAACQRSFRTANMKCIAELEQSGRDALFGRGSPPELPESLNPEKSRLQAKSSLVAERGRAAATDRLASISRQLAETLQRSSDAVSTLAESSHSLTETKEELQGQGSVLGQSRRLITKYARREVTDRVLILFAFAFYFACVFYILRKRVLGPLDPLALIWSAVRAFAVALANIIRTLQQGIYTLYHFYVFGSDGSFDYEPESVDMMNNPL